MSTLKYEKQYEMALNVYEKIGRGEELKKNERNWKKKYMKVREESVKEENGVKVTRYMPNWS
tara:strand:- start:2755 stop:2940 length:186 start_codon:yes stop_codon:yes gene_type:complete